MSPSFLVPETELRESGSGEVLDLGSPAANREFLSLTLGITHIVEQESLDVAIQGSADGVNWPGKALLSFPQKFYCGTYQMLLDLKAHPGVRFLRAKWTLNRWGRGELKPLFCIYLFVQEQRAAAIARGAA